MSDGLARWIDARQPPPPPALATRMREILRARGGEPRVALLDGAEALLREGLRDPAGGDRRAAYRLLAADALLTYACEAGLEAEDPTAFFEEALARVGRMGEGE